MVGRGCVRHLPVDHHPEIIWRHLIEKWIGKLSQPSKAHNGMPECPFAKGADVVYRAARHEILLTSLRLSRDLKPRQIIMLSFNPGSFSLKRIEDDVDRLNQLLKSKDRIVLFTHPDSDEPSHPTLGIVFIQHRSEMISAVNILRRTSYYDTMSLPEWYS
jgi:hypothetical protein